MAKTKIMNGQKKEIEQAKPAPFSGENLARSATLRDDLGRFVTGHEGAMIKRYPTQPLLIEEVLKYLHSCNDLKRNPTVTGLALSLGFTSRRALLNYSKEEGYEFAFEVIAFAKMKIEEYLEERLLDHRNTNIAGLIFNLKNNFDWADKSEIKMDQRTMQFNGFEIEGLNDGKVIDIKQD